MPALPLSILDLVAVSSNQTPADAIEASLLSTASADRLGYERVWFAEHHNTAAVASSATAVLVGQALARTNRIRVGSGGVMLPNHAPLMVAEAYGTLAQLYPGRVDLGLGRAPGTDQVTARALARSSAAPEHFVANVTDLMRWFSSGVASDGIRAGVAEGTQVPLWMLGSSTTGAAMAARLGLPYSFASHFAPAAMAEAIQLYRETFNADSPTAQVERPYVSVGVNVLAADDGDTARHEFTTVRNMFLALHRSGGREKIQPPGDPREPAHPMALAMVDDLLQVSAVGTPTEVRDGLARIAEQTGADELITVTYAYDPAVRLRSIELVADAWFS